MSSAEGEGTHSLLAVDGRPVLRYRFSPQEEPTADDAEPLAPLTIVVPAVLDQLSGWWLSTGDEALLDALLAAGATVARHAHVYSYPLAGPGAMAPPVGAALAPGLALGPIDRSPAELAPLVLAAYPPGHVDHLGDATVEEAELGALLGGELVGPFLAGASAQVTNDANHVVAAVIVNRAGGSSPLGGPWVTQVLRHPDPAWAGLGSRLLIHALAVLAADGEPSLGLAVTDGNPARRVYQRLGFQHLASRRKLAIP